MISIKEAVEILGCSSSALCQKKGRYYRWYCPAEPGRNNAKFNITAYLKHKEELNNKIQASTLLIEELNKEKGMSYQSIADAVGACRSSISGHHITEKVANKLLERFNNDKY